jgi:two-component system alkaline phosphatase synthesis response regulator PhoP
MKPRILIVEDEVHLMELLLINLEAEGYECYKSTNGKTALELVESKLPDLVLLDVMIPILNGFETATKIIAAHPKLPIIFLTARGDDQDKIKGLKTGGVDYILKPFNLEELLLRVKIHLKNTENPRSINQITIGDYQVNIDNFEISCKNKVVSNIGKKELQLLILLFENAGKVVSREQIMTRIWGNEVETTSRTVDNYILSFRKIFNDDPKAPKYFHSIRGVGYKLTP